MQVRESLPSMMLDSSKAITNNLQARATMAQLYFEHRRVWTVNTSGHWLFDSVESGGVGIKTDFAAAAVAGSNTKVQLVMPTTKSVSSKAVFDCFAASFKKDIARETREIIERVKAVKRQGVKQRTFRDFDHIICFGSYTRRVLADMEKHAQSQIPVDGRPLKVQISMLQVEPPPEHPSDEILQKTLAAVREKVDGFLVSHFNWTQPPTPLWKGLYRTRQFLLVHSKKEIVRAKTAEIRKRDGCELIRDSSVPHGRLVTIVAPQEFGGLEKFEEEVKAACS